MRSVNVATLKNNLSRYLTAVRRGEEIVITSHRHPVVRIVPAEKPSVDDLKIIPARKPVSSLKRIKGMDLQEDLLAELLANRTRR